MKIAVALGLLLLIGSSAGQSAGSSVLREESGLRAPISAKLPFATLREVLSHVEASTGVPVRAAPSISNDNVTVLVREKPAEEVLESLATVLSYHWRRVNESSNRTYLELYQDQKSRDSERQRLVKMRRNGLEAIREEIVRRIGVAALEPDEAKRRLAALEKELRDPELPASTRASLRAEVRGLRARPSSEQSGLLGTYLRLAPSLRPQLEPGGTVRLSSVAREGMGLLPAWARGSQLKIRSESPSRDSAWLEWARRNEKALEVRLQCQVRWLGRTAKFAIRDSVLGPPRDEPYVDQIGSFFTVALPLSDTTPQEDVRGSSVEIEDRWSIPVKKPDTDEPLSSYPPATLMDMLAEVHRRFPSVTVIGDAALRPLTLLTDSRPKKLGSLLNEAADSVGSRWWLDKRGFISVRSRTQDMDRLTSIPASTIRSLAARSKAGGGLKLGDYAWLSRELTNDQVRANFPMPPGPTLVFPEGALNPATLGAAYQDLRLLSSLSERQSKGLLRGETLGATDLTRPQALLFVAAMNDADDWVGSPGEFESWSPRQLSGVALRIEETASAMSGGRSSLTISYMHAERKEPLRRITVFF